MSARIRKTRRSRLRCRKTCDFYGRARTRSFDARPLHRCQPHGNEHWELALYGVEYEFRHTPVNILLSTLWIVAFLVGVTMLIKARAITEWISDRL
jgi:hypothetical protein